MFPDHFRHFSAIDCPAAVVYVADSQPSFHPPALAEPHKEIPAFI
jgi:hypothetical protein